MSADPLLEVAAELRPLARTTARALFARLVADEVRAIAAEVADRTTAVADEIPQPQAERVRTCRICDEEHVIAAGRVCAKCKARAARERRHREREEAKRTSASTTTNGAAPSERELAATGARGVRAAEIARGLRADPAVSTSLAPPD